LSTETMGTSLIITGVGGQGNVMAARLLASAVLEAGWEVTVGDVYGLTQRGGSVASHVRWIQGELLPPLVPQCSLDILVAFEPLEALRVLSQLGGETTRAIVNTQSIIPIGVQAGRFQYPQLDKLYAAIRNLSKESVFVDATKEARALGNVQALNMVMVGTLYGSGWVPFSPTAFEKVIRSSIRSQFQTPNVEAFRRGLELAEAPY
jgi:indolepyruvate ferredoxin oxidoreductase, beta subunit